ncbi:hypothetical protein TNCV_2845571 [Trichonephila clavipes]|nr:hypothetical protein TNCV_2845571 [Trichonephila clavipes]
MPAMIRSHDHGATIALRFVSNCSFSRRPIKLYILSRGNIFIHLYKGGDNCSSLRKYIDSLYETIMLAYTKLVQTISSTLPHLYIAANEFLSSRAPPGTPGPECCLSHLSQPVEPPLPIHDAP